MERSELPLPLSTLKKWYENGSLACTLSFQRKSGVWGMQTKGELIWSVLSNYYIPPIVLIKEDNKKYEILDGLQRLSTIFSFMNDEYKLYDGIGKVVVDGDTFEVNNKSFSELPEELQDVIKNYHFTIQALSDCSNSEAEKLFYNINSGIALSTIQKAKPMLGSEVMEEINVILSGNFFSNCVYLTDAQLRREDDLLMLLQGILLMSGMSYKNLSARECLNLATHFSLKKTEMDVVRQVIAFLDDGFTEEKKYLKRNNVPIIIDLVMNVLDKTDSKSFASFCDNFFENTPIEYKEASGVGNIKKSKVEERRRIIKESFMEVMYDK